MENYTIKILCLALVLFVAAGVNAQTATKKISTKTKTTKSKSNTTAPKSTPVAITVTLTSKCEKQVMIYSGPKVGLREPKQRQVGGLSANKLYLKTGDVVCIMDAKKKPISCVTITKATLKLEINFAGTALSP